MIRRAQQIAVAQKNATPEQRDDRRVGEHVTTGASLEGRAVQKIPIAVHDEHRSACGDTGGEAAAYGVANRVRVVVTDPGFEQVAEHVQRAGGARLTAQKAHERVVRLGRCRVEV